MAVRLVKKSATLRLGARGGRIVAVADTHSRPHSAMAAHLAALEPDAILHAGDIGELAVLDDLGAAAPVYAVRGNIDTRADGVPDVLTLDIERGTERFRLLMVHIAVYGPRLRGDVARMASAAGASLVVCGHSHVPFIGQDRGLAVFNPGSIGPRRFTLPIVFGLIEIAATGIRLTHIDCETGQPWHPPPLPA